MHLIIAPSLLVLAGLLIIIAGCMRDEKPVRYNFKVVSKVVWYEIKPVANATNTKE
jgi:hypothetical protein